MSDPFILVVGLWIVPGRGEEFETFERSAFSIIDRHGGSLVRRLALRDGMGSDVPNELHVVSFPSRDAYVGYRADPELTSLSALRARAVLRTVIWEGVDLPPFGDAP